MEVQNHNAVIQTLIDAVVAAGDQPSKVARILLSPEEMQIVQRSGAFTRSVSKYYGGSDTITMENIVADRQGNFISFFLNGILVARNVSVPTQFDGIVYPAVTNDNMDQTVFTALETDGVTETMLVGPGNPVDDFVMARSAFIELGVAVRMVGDPSNYASDSGEYEFSVGANGVWSFAVTVGSLHPTIKNVTDLYDIALHIDCDPSSLVTSRTLKLVYVEQLNGQAYENYMWVDQMQNPVFTDTATNGDKSVSQMVQTYTHSAIKPFILGDADDYNDVGTPIGEFSISLEATPKWAQYSEVAVATAVAVIS